MHLELEAEFAIGIVADSFSVNLNKYDYIIGITRFLFLAET